MYNGHKLSDWHFISLWSEGWHSQTIRLTDIASYRLNRPRGRIDEKAATVLYCCSREEPGPETVSRRTLERLEELGLGPPQLAAIMREAAIEDFQEVLQASDTLKQSIKNLS